MELTTEQLAQDLARAFVDGQLLPPLPDRVLADAAAVAGVAAAARAAVDWDLAGWKIGATSPAARRIMATDQPFYGPVYRPRVMASGADVVLPPGFFGFECEMALRLGVDLPAKDDGYPADALRIAVDGVVLAIELVAARQRLEGIGDARRAAVDFGYNHGLVLGPTLAPPPVDALAEVEVVAMVDDLEVGRGSGSEVLGHPLQALAWLTRQGVALTAGQIVSTGTCTGIARLEAGQTARARYTLGGEVLGEVSFRAAN